MRPLNGWRPVWRTSALCSSPARGQGLEQELVGSGEMVCVFPQDHPLAARSEVTVADLHSHAYVALERDGLLGSLLQRAFFW
jgi:DNA-binding transcriptional LysR family regulator